MVKTAWERLLVSFILVAATVLGGQISEGGGLRFFPGTATDLGSLGPNPGLPHALPLEQPPYRPGHWLSGWLWEERVLGQDPQPEEWRRKALLSPGPSPTQPPHRQGLTWLYCRSP